MFVLRRSRPMIRHWLLAGVLWAGCPCAPKPTVDAGVAQGVREPVRDAGLPPSKLATLTPLTLSLFEPKDGACHWVLLEPTTGARVELTSLAGACTGIKVTWSPKRTFALLWRDPTNVQHSMFAADHFSAPKLPDEPPGEGHGELFVVQLSDGKTTPVSFPEVGSGEPRVFGVDDSGRALAFLEQTLTEAETSSGTATAFGKTYDLSEIHDGAPALAHAFRFEGKWRHVETAVTSTGFDYAMGVDALELARAHGGRSDELSSAALGGDGATDEEVTALAPLLPKGMTAEDGSWVFVGAGGRRVYVWTLTAEGSWATGLVATLGPTQKLPELATSDGDLVSVRPNGAHLLITVANVGTHPRLYSFPEARVVWKSDSARAVSFWPGAAKPESHEP